MFIPGYELLRCIFYTINNYSAPPAESTYEMVINFRTGEEDNTRTISLTLPIYIYSL